MTSVELNKIALDDCNCGCHKVDEDSLCMSCTCAFETDPPDGIPAWFKKKVDRSIDDYCDV